MASQKTSARTDGDRHPSAARLIVDTLTPSLRQRSRDRKPRSAPLRVYLPVRTAIGNASQAEPMCCFVDEKRGAQSSGKNERVMIVPGITPSALGIIHDG